MKIIVPTTADAERNSEKITTTESNDRESRNKSPKKFYHELGRGLVARAKSGSHNGGSACTTHRATRAGRTGHARKGEPGVQAGTVSGSDGEAAGLHVINEDEDGECELSFGARKPAFRRFE